MPTKIRRHRSRCLSKICTVILNYRKLRLNETVLSPCSGPFYQPTLRDNRPTSAVSALFFIEERVWYFMQIVSSGDKSNHIFWESKTVFQNVVCLFLLKRTSSGTPKFPNTLFNLFFLFFFFFFFLSFYIPKKQVHLTPW